MSAPSLALLAALCILTIIVPRRYFFFPYIVAICFVPMNQRVVISGLDFTILRILILCGVVRLFARNEWLPIKFNYFDKLIVSWNIIGATVYVIQWGTFSAFVNRAGFVFDCIGMYWLTRQFVRDWENIIEAIKLFAILALTTAPLIAAEKLFPPSLYTIFGPVESQFHRGRFRCAGPFPHPIMMGCFWAGVIPFFFERIKTLKKKKFYWLAIFAALSNIIFSGSSTPLLGLAGIIFFWFIFKYRKHGKRILWGITSFLLVLHILWDKPVWYLLAKANIFAGSTGWHRYNLFNQFMNRMGEWFLFGTKTTAHWDVWGNLVDITNQFVLEGVRGGIATLIIFIMIVYRAVQIPGRFSLHTDSKEQMWISWAICVSVLGHFVNFWGVSYFGQINMLLYMTFAFVSFFLSESANLVKDV